MEKEWKYQTIPPAQKKCWFALLRSKHKQGTFILEIVMHRFYLVMQQCWMGDPQERPTFSKLVVDLSTMLTKVSNYLDLNETIAIEAASGTETEEITTQ